jgi:hypothetical protein
VDLKTTRFTFHDRLPQALKPWGSLQQHRRSTFIHIALHYAHLAPAGPVDAAAAAPAAATAVHVLDAVEAVALASGGLSTVLLLAGAGTRADAAFAAASPAAALLPELLPEVLPEVLLTGLLCEALAALLVLAAMLTAAATSASFCPVTWAVLLVLELAAIADSAT